MAIDGLSVVYKVLKDLNDPAYSGIHFQSLKAAYRIVHGSKQAWQKRETLFSSVVEVNPEFSELGDGPKVAHISIRGTE